jgi:hypothetical protein
MRLSLVGALLVVVLVIAVTGERLASQQPAVPLVDTQAQGSGNLLAHVWSADGQSQVVTVIDSRQRVLAVYHVDRTTGQITPKSIRNITWDLQMIDFNTGSPLPQDIRSGLQR